MARNTGCVMVPTFLSERSTLSPGKRLHHQRSSRHAMVPLSDTSPQRSTKFGISWGTTCTLSSPSVDTHPPVCLSHMNKELCAFHGLEQGRRTE